MLFLNFFFISVFVSAFTCAQADAGGQGGALQIKGRRKKQSLGLFPERKLDIIIRC